MTEFDNEETEIKAAQEDVAHSLGKIVEESGILPTEAVQRILKENPDLQDAFIQGVQKARQDKEDSV